MEDSLTNAFRRYAELICATLRNHRAFDGRLRETGIVMLQLDKRFEFLPWMVEQMEEDEPFRHLVMATRATFPDQHYTQNDGLASHAVKNFFRRSGFYLDVFEGNNPNIDRVLEEYAVPFREKERQITYLTLLQGIKFSAPGSGMKFDNFEIRRFSGTELAAISGNRVNQVFYPWAMLNVERLRDHWFIVQNCSQYHSQSDEDDSACFDRIARALSHMDIVTPVYKPFVEEFPFGSPLQILSLFPWHKHMLGGEEEWGRGAWSSYHFPFTIEVHDGLIWGPHPTPDLSALDLAPVAYNLPNGEVFDGEEIPTWIDFDEDNTHHFKFFVQHKEQYFAELKSREHGWEFFERAIAYFMKASRSTGLEQLLWNIITMEALLGENKEGGNKIFKGRINRILRNNNIKKKSRKMISIEDLYKFRNDLVHGKQFNDDDPVLVSHLTAAWNMARKTLLWSLHYLHAVQVCMSSGRVGATIPSREQLLKFLDECEKTQQSPNWLMNSLPVGFPYIQGWIE